MLMQLIVLISSKDLSAGEHQFYNRHVVINKTSGENIKHPTKLISCYVE